MGLGRGDVVDVCVHLYVYVMYCKKRIIKTLEKKNMPWHSVWPGGQTVNCSSVSKFCSHRSSHHNLALIQKDLQEKLLKGTSNSYSPSLLLI